MVIKKRSSGDKHEKVLYILSTLVVDWQSTFTVGPPLDNVERFTFLKMTSTIQVIGETKW